MSCAAEDIKRKVVSADLFQTPKRQEASAFGAFNSFFVLPVGVLVYAILLRTVFNPIESETEMIVTKNCTQFNFTCTTLYGCEVAAMGKRTTEKFSKGNRSLFLKQGQRMNESICPGLNEALDIAPRAAVYVGDDGIGSSFEHEGMGYFGSDQGILYQVNLTNMRLVNQSKVSDNWLNTGFASGGYGYVGGDGGREVRFEDLGKSQVGKVDHLHRLRVQRLWVFSGYGIYQVDLTTMEVINQKQIRVLMGKQSGRDYGFSAVNKIIYKVDLKTLNYTQSKPLGEVLIRVLRGQFGELFREDLGVRYGSNGEYNTTT